jgi:adenosylcobinamide kinase/adenosylcobinamide-phosphate guanylyltransferase
MPITLVLGGARSGKSAFAQRQAEAAAAKAGQAPLMIATAEALDAEMAARIARHQAERGPVWRTREAPVELAAAIRDLATGEVAVVDCLTLWLSNLMHREIDLEGATRALDTALDQTPGDIWLVTNEVGMGIVPENALARRFRDAAGRLNQTLAERADAIALLFAGQALWLKGGVAPFNTSHPRGSGDPGVFVA